MPEENPQETEEQPNAESSDIVDRAAGMAGATKEAVSQKFGDFMAYDEGDTLRLAFTAPKILSDVVIAQLKKTATEAVDEAARLGKTKIVFDLKGVTFMSSAMAVDGFVLTNKKAKACKIEMELINVSPSIYEVFEITRLNRAFKINGKIVED